MWYKSSPIEHNLLGNRLVKSFCKVLAIYGFSGILFVYKGAIGKIDQVQKKKKRLETNLAGKLIFVCRLLSKRRSGISMQ